MDYSKIFINLKKAFPDLEIHLNHPLAPYTTLKIGGPADIFIQTKNNFQFKSILKFVYDQRSSINDPKITILGNGSNILISDQGIKGVVIKNSSQKIQIITGSPDTSKPHSTIDSRRNENNKKEYLDLQSLDYEESGAPCVSVKIDSGVFLPYTINYLLDQNITGLQWFAYIPATIGGAVVSNLHGSNRHFSDLLKKIEVFNLKTGKKEKITASDLNWAYDYSFFQDNPHLIILNVTLSLYQGDVVKARHIVQEWINQKSLVQPMNSAGSVFKNPTLDQCLPIWGEQKSAGWIIDQELNWKGKSVGGAQISLKHGNFIVNTGQATAADYLKLVKSIQSEIYHRFKIHLELEIKLLGNF